MAAKIISKCCSKCKKFKLISEFHHDSRQIDKHALSCKTCEIKRNKEYRQTKNGREAHRRENRKYQQSKKGKFARKRYQQSEKGKLCSKRYYGRFPNKKNQWQRNNPQKARKRHRLWYMRNKNNPKLKLSYAIRSGIRYSLKTGSKNGKTWDILDYNLDELMRHLETQFQQGMNWQNYGQWEIDHKKPIKAFSFNNSQDKDFKQCWALANLQPLWAKDNQRKAALWIEIKKT